MTPHKTDTFLVETSTAGLVRVTMTTVGNGAFVAVNTVVKRPLKTTVRPAVWVSDMREVANLIPN